MFLSKYLKQYEKPVLFGIVILIAITFGISSQAILISDRSESGPAFKYFGETVTLKEWHAFLGRWRALYSVLVPGQHFPDQAIEIEAKRAMTTLHEANAAGIEVSNGEVAQFLQRMLQHTPGQFNTDNYLAGMRERRIRVDDFEESVRDFLKINKFQRISSESASISLKSVFDEYVKENEEARADVVVFKGRDFGRKIVDVSGAEIAADFTANKAKYRIPDRVQVAYVLAAHDALEAQIKDPGDEELKKFYDAHKEHWAITEPVGPDKGAEAGKEEGKKDEGKKDEGKKDEGKKDEVKKDEVKKDEVKKDEAKKDEGKKDEAKKDEPKKDEPKKDEPKKEEPKKDTDKDGEKDAKEANPEKDAAKFKPFDQVRADVLKLYVSDKAQETAIEKIEELERAVDEARLNIDNQDVNLEALAKKIGLQYNVTGYFSQTNINTIFETVGYSPKFAQLVFTMEEGEYSQPMATEKGWFLYRVLRKKPAEEGRITEDVRKAVIRDIQARKGQESARKAADDFQAAVKVKIEAKQKEVVPAETNPAELARKQLEVARTVFAEAAKEKNLKLEKSDWFKRDGYIPGLKTYSSDLAKLAFLVDPGIAGVSDAFQEVYVFQVEAKRPPDSAAFATQRDFLREKLLRSARQSFVQNWMRVMQDNAAFEDLTVKPKPKIIEETDTEAPKSGPPDHGDDDN